MEWVEGGVMIWSDKMLIIVCCMKWICDRMNMTMLLDWMNDGIDVCNDRIDMLMGSGVEEGEYYIHFSLGILSFSLG